MVCLPPAMLGELFPTELAAAFANFKLWQSLLMGIAFVLSSALVAKPKLYLWLNVILLVVSVVCALIALRLGKKSSSKAA